MCDAKGLLDYYHQMGERFAYEAALGIGENGLRHLDRPALRRPAGSAARETGVGAVPPRGALLNGRTAHSPERLRALFKALLHRAFTGELTAGG